MDRNKYLRRVVSATNLQTEQLPGMPVVEIAGDCRVLIERHLGVIGYDCNVIRIKTKKGQICVQGSNLELTQMSKFTLVIYGKIHSVHLVTERC